jgi:hypothetical protein
MLRNNACQARSSHRQETADCGSDTIGTKDVIDITNRMSIVELPGTQSHRANAQNDFRNGRFIWSISPDPGNMGKRSRLPSGEFTRGGGASGETELWIRVGG